MISDAAFPPTPVGHDSDALAVPTATVTVTRRHDVYSKDQGYHIAAAPVYSTALRTAMDRKGISTDSITVVRPTMCPANAMEISRDALTFFVGGVRMGSGRYVAAQLQTLFEQRYGYPLLYVAVNDVPACYEIYSCSYGGVEWLSAVELALRKVPQELRVLQRKQGQNTAVRVAIDTYDLATMSTTATLGTPETFGERVRQILDREGIPSHISVRKNPGGVRLTVDRRHAANFAAMHGTALQDSDGSLVCVRDASLAPYLAQLSVACAAEFQRIACLSRQPVTIEFKR